MGKGKEGKGEERISPRARAREARRWLHRNYGLTDDEADAVITEAERRAPNPITHLVPYLAGMADRGDLADIVAAVQATTEPPDTPDPTEPGPAPDPAPASTEPACPRHPHGAAIDPNPPTGWGNCLICNTHRHRANRRERQGAEP
ncbi:hypothetical protein SAMN04489712_105262 [Thermomonospora echinospora]|uniref:Uncharacterized protein n=1 Tax=Thermomonospora echinospora TaxID=1992 RepID=A0A1H6AA66_9ACTN|nr:hypothetical protein [Thermomonospora echinospora]SEG44636.1 hypothetical protein SAMN04489712_105262 [Thermomonospora echinospora]